MDAEAYRAESRARWEAAAAGWGRHRAEIQRDAMEVSRWLLDAAQLQPGHTVVELAAGAGDTGLMEPDPPGAPGPLAFGRPGRIAELLDAAGFDDVVVESLDFAIREPNLDAWWDHAVATSGRLSRVVRGLSPAEHYSLRDEVDAAYAPFVAADGSVELPARTYVAAASA